MQKAKVRAWSKVKGHYTYMYMVHVEKHTCISTIYMYVMPMSIHTHGHKARIGKGAMRRHTRSLTLWHIWQVVTQCVMVKLFLLTCSRLCTHSYIRELTVMRPVAGGDAVCDGLIGPGGHLRHLPPPPGDDASPRAYSMTRSFSNH